MLAKQNCLSVTSLDKKTALLVTLLTRQTVIMCVPDGKLGCLRAGCCLDNS